ncbi:hypothetical protein DSO57_1024749 [Entomophthora muscae]|uniref:Uncharacterized protein n=1 Tax=Entomophthora muscae TaxID=34485 RepID=A0ACC2RH40_9FUNG|nr:hypothetical protein DSO57_1024749 [Entomophthora muscae]
MRFLVGLISLRYTGFSVASEEITWDNAMGKIRPEVIGAMLQPQAMIPILVQFTGPSSWEGPQDQIWDHLNMLTESTLTRVGSLFKDLQAQGEVSQYRLYPIANALAIEATPTAICRIVYLDDVMEVSTNMPMRNMYNIVSTSN